jgi:DNA-binding TFAR19-related protein (PDSD5 family)
MDDELERIKQKRLEELQRKMLLQKIKEQIPEPEPAPKEPTHDEILNSYFKGRAWEVYNAAKYQYPKVIPKVEQVLIDGIKQGKIRESIDGASLYQFFRQIGIPVRLNTKIRVSEHGELKTLEQVMKEKE